MKLTRSLGVLFVASAAGCATVRAPALEGSSWHGQDSPRLEADLRYNLSALPDGWLHRTEESEGTGSFAYRKRSGTYVYSERGYFFVDPTWRKDRSYVGLLKPGGIFCVANPEQQSSEAEDLGTGMTTISYMTVYDYCVQLHGL